jgi:hypothetical protein
MQLPDQVSDCHLLHVIRTRFQYSIPRRARMPFWQAKFYSPHPAALDRLSQSGYEAGDDLAIARPRRNCDALHGEL